MATISAEKETIYRGSFDEYGTVSVARITRITDDEGEVTERIHRRAFTPDDDVSSYPQPLQDLVAAARYPAAVARYEATKAD